MLDIHELTKLNNQINNYQQKIRELEQRRINNEPDMYDVIRLLKIRFRDILPFFKKSSYKEINKMLPLLYSFYAGMIYEDAQQTGLYKGPAVHRVKTILDQYIPRLHLLLWDDSDSICRIYSDLNTMGKSK